MQESLPQPSCSLFFLLLPYLHALLSLPFVIPLNFLSFSLCHVPVLSPLKSGTALNHLEGMHVKPPSLRGRAIIPNYIIRFKDSGPLNNIQRTRPGAQHRN